MLYYLLYAATAITLVYFLVAKKPFYGKPASMAIVMSYGIFAQSVMPQFKVNLLYIQFLTMLIVVISVFLLVSYLKAFMEGSFKQNYYQDPLERYAIGTWIAGSSVSLMLLSEHFSLATSFIKSAGFLIIAGWIIYLLFMLKSVPSIYENGREDSLHGIVLLTVVATQSMVLMANTIWKSIQSMTWLNSSVIVFGILLYLLYATMVVTRYIKGNWSLADDWKNTNCILHGSISITGSAAALSQSFGYTAILFIWILAVTVFVIHELIEGARGLVRIKAYGLVQGIFSYDVSQWSRVFTFGMLYAFTSFFKTNYTITNSIVSAMLKAVLTYGKWAILGLVLIESALLVKSLFTTARTA
ncbi:hypothetical protein [Sediminibacillus massiliensis]|uniref:hypothetical protein n=1 Tax=Sediminibacillus massiliensis TaxID=1926277 RepID=UPI000988913B|nr:hypothetical protein [Sediminibacillus massiliensis]